MKLDIQSEDPYSAKCPTAPSGARKDVQANRCSTRTSFRNLSLLRLGHSGFLKSRVTSKTGICGTVSAVSDPRILKAGKQEALMLDIDLCFETVLQTMDPNLVQRRRASWMRDYVRWQTSEDILP